jgi:hypothetical protein
MLFRGGVCIFARLGGGGGGVGDFNATNHGATRYCFLSLDLCPWLVVDGVGHPKLGVVAYVV